jgi:hypothetical protein
MPQICDMGQTACCGFFRPKNPTASSGFEPAILGARGQHAYHQTTEAAMPVALVTQHALRMRRMAICGLFGSAKFFHIIS